MPNPLSTQNIQPQSKSRLSRRKSAIEIAKNKEFFNLNSVKLAASKVNSHIESWRTELKNDVDKAYLLDGIQYGFDILEGKSPDFRACMTNYKSATDSNRDKVEAQIVDELAQGNYLEVKSPPLVVSSLGAIPKSNGKIRLIHDLSRPRGGVNQFVKDSSVSYLTVDHATTLMSPNCYCAKVDLRNAYRSIPIHPNNYPYTGLSWIFKNENTKSFLIDTKLPFGSKKACKIFTAISNSIARMLNRRGISNVNYLDDILIIGESKEKCWLALDSTVNLLTSLGLDVNWNKMEYPSQIVTFLGVKIDTASRTLTLPDDKLSELKELVALWNTKKRVSKLDLLKLCGKLNWACRVIRGGRTFLRRLIDLSCKVKANHHRLWLNREARADLDWWATGLEVFHGSACFVCDLSPPHGSFETDACRESGGGLYMHDWFYVNFEKDLPEWKNAHINTLELLTVLVACQRWGHLWRNKHLQVKCDNLASVYAINKGSSRSPEFMRVLREIFWLSVIHEFRLTAVHVKGTHNIIADSISRLHLPNFQKIFRSLFPLTSSVNCFNNMSFSSFQMLQGYTQK